MHKKPFFPTSITSIGVPIMLTLAVTLGGVLSTPSYAQNIPDDTTIQQAQNTQAEGPAAGQSQTNAWFWWLLPLGALAVLFLLLRRSIQNREDEFQHRYYRDDQSIAGAKGGEVERSRDNHIDESQGDPDTSQADPWDHDQDDWSV